MRTNQRHSALVLAALALLFLAPSSNANASGRTFSGEYDWSDGGTGALSAEFTPSGDQQWKVEFRFGFNGRDSTWRGTAEGALEDGSRLTGTARWKKRNWVFEATIENGTMNGTHTEIRRDGGRYETGTFAISTEGSQESTE